ncbi:MAG: PAS domain S-box protein [Paludibacteraceae bacterium]|nr:PAS domain S-box protein [Paludibacteraceae bacterium]
MTILLIEDDPGIATLMQSELEDLNYKVQWVEDFEKADQWLAENCDELLMIVDYSIAGVKNAQDWIKARKEKGLCNPPFIMSTGQGDERIAVEMMKLGARDYLVKDSLLFDRLPDIMKRIQQELENENKLAYAEKQIRQISEFYKNIIENASDGIVLVDHTKHFKYISSSAQKIFGYQPSDLINLTANDITHPDDLDYILKHVERVFNDAGYAPTLQCRLKHKHGHWIWVESKLTNLLSNNAVNSVVINFRNIDDRKNSEQLIERLNAFRQLLMDISTSFINLPLDEVNTVILESLEKLGRFVKADRSYIFDYDFENKLAYNTYEWCNTDITSQISNLQAIPLSEMEEWPLTHARAEVIYIPDMRRYKGGSSKKTLEAQGIKSLIAIPLMDDGKCIGFAGFDSVLTFHEYSESEQNLLKVFTQVLVNTHKRKKALISLRKSEVRYRELFARNPQPMWIFDTETLAFLEVNDAACKHYGYTHEEFLTLNIRNIRPKEDMPLLYKNLELMNLGIRTEVYARHCCKNGDIIHVELTSSPTSVNGRKALHVMVNDITQRKLANEQLQKKRDILNKLLYESSELIQTKHTTPDYEKLAGILHSISEARFVSFNLFDEQSKSYRTKAMSGLDNYTNLSKKYLGFNLLDHEWKEGPVRYFNNRVEVVSIYKNIGEISGKQIPAFVVKLIENSFNTGKVAVVTITNFDEMLGHFLLIYPKNKEPENLEILELYGSQVGQYLARKKSEELVLESENRYKSIFESSFESIMLTSPDGSVYSANPACCNLFGYSEEEILKGGRKLLVDATDPRLKTALETREQTGTFAGEISMIRKNGEKFEAELSSTIFHNKAGLLKTSITIRDISQRKRNEQLLLDSEKKYRQLFASNPQVMWIYDVSTLKFIEVNQAAIHHYGYSQEEFQNMTILDIRPKDEHHRMIESVRNQENMDFSGDWTHIKKNGEHIIVEITSYAIVADGRKARHVLINDITERRRAERQLQEKMDELIRFHKLTVDRELNMINLKKEINELLKATGKDEKYKIF